MKSNSKNISSSVLLLSIILLMFPFKTIAQYKWSLNLRPAANFATLKLGDATLEKGFGGIGTIAYQFVPQLAIYAGWSWNQFSTDHLFEYNNIDVQETGYRTGLTFTQPFGSSKFKYLLGGGALYNHIEVENADGTIIDDSGHGWGWQAETGLVFPLGNHFNLAPTVGYQALKRNLNNGNVATSVDLNYVSAGLKLSYLF